jgi:hypothetical protein
MSQSDFKYLLNRRDYPNLTSPWSLKGIDIKLSPSNLGRLGNKYLQTHSIDWSNLSANGLAFQDFSNKLEMEDVDCLSEFLLLKWFADAPIDKIHTDILDVWINWQNSKLSRSEGHEALNHLAKHNEEHLLMLYKVYKFLDTNSISDDLEYGKFVRKQWLPLSQKFKQMIEENKDHIEFYYIES